jgi:hypothetical protein
MNHYRAPVSKQGQGEKLFVISALKLQMEDAFPVVNFHASQVGYTPVVKISNVLNIRKVEK